MRDSWSRWRSLAPAERDVLARALGQLPLAALALRVLGLRRVQAMCARAGPFPAPRRATGSLEAATVARLVDAAARHSIIVRPNCLQRSVVLWGILRRHGMDGELRIGVLRLPAGPTPRFHAWVEYDGVVLNDRQDVRSRYVTFDRPVGPSARPDAGGWGPGGPPGEAPTR